MLILTCGFLLYCKCKLSKFGSDDSSSVTTLGQKKQMVLITIRIVMPSSLLGWCECDQVSIIYLWIWQWMSINRRAGIVFFNQFYSSLYFLKLPSSPCRGVHFKSVALRKCQSHCFPIALPELSMINYKSSISNMVRHIWLAHWNRNLS